MDKGILLERDGREGIVLTPRGEFKRVRLTRPSDVGDEVEFTATPAFRGGRWFLGVAAAAAVLLFALVPALWPGAPARLPPVTDPLPPVDGPLPGAPARLPSVTGPLPPLPVGSVVGAPIALISIDINPSVELWVDQQERVTAARARNADGETLLAAVEYQGQQVRGVVLALTDAAAHQGYFAQHDVEPTVVVGVAPVDAGLLPAEDEERLLTEVMAAAREAVSRQGDAAVVRVAVVAAPATVEQRDRAESLGTTPGRLAVAEAMLAVAPADMSLTLEQVLAAPPGQVRNQIRERAGTDPWPEMEKVLRAKPAKGKPAEADAPGDDKPGDDGPGRGRGSDDPPGNGAPGNNGPGQGRGRGSDDPPGNGAPGNGAPGNNGPGRGAGNNGQNRGPAR